MNDNTINNDVTMGGSEGTLLANRYRVVRQLGQGGMGSVWLAEDTQLDNRQVAIKMLPSVLVLNKRAYQQLKAEALVSLKLTHPNIATVRAFEENNGNPFLVVDYIDGVTLDDYLLEKSDAGRAASMRPPQSSGLPESEVIRLLTPIAAALDYAHLKGVVHRDVKPGNVMIAKDGTPYILDFGIAREIQETMTRVTGKLSSGTLMYMSPEQLNGDAPSAAQDIYSFAVMAYECLTGAPPFSRGNIEYQIMNKAPAPLDSHIIISESIMSGLAKRPEDRPANCAAVLSAGGGHGVTALPVGDGDNGADEDGRARAPHKPRRWGVTAATLLVIAVMGGVGYAWYRGQQDALFKQEKIARLAEEKKALDAEKAAAVKRHRDAAIAAFERKEWKFALEEALKTDLKDMDLVFKIAKCHVLGLGVERDYVQAEKWVRKGTAQGYAASQNLLGLMYENGCGVPTNYVEAAKWYRKSAEQGYAAAQNNLGSAYQNGLGIQRDYVEAVKWYRKSAEQKNAMAEDNLGRMYLNGRGVTKDYAEAEKWFRKSAERGNADAGFCLGWMYENGRGVAADTSEAAKWYGMAAKQGDENAKKALERLIESVGAKEGAK